MKKGLAVSVCAGLLFFAASFTAAEASLTDFTITYTADNQIDTLSVQQGATTTGLTLGPNVANWQAADSVKVTLESSQKFDIVWQCENWVPPKWNTYNNPDNPAGLLAQVTYGANTLLSGVNTANVTWQIYDTGKSQWVSASTWGNNGGSNIWTSVNGGPVGGIGTGAQWLWDKDNTTPQSATTLLIRADYSPVPIPGAFWLLGSGLAGMIGVRRKYFG